VLFIGKTISFHVKTSDTQEAIEFARSTDTQTTRRSMHRQDALIAEIEGRPWELFAMAPGDTSIETQNSRIAAIPGGATLRKRSDGGVIDVP
jgi:hypothetical protein